MPVVPAGCAAHPGAIAASPRERPIGETVARAASAGPGSMSEAGRRGSDAPPARSASVDRRALTAVAAQFFANGALFASFVPRLPEIRDQVDIGVAHLGLLMSVAGATGLVGSATVGPAIVRLGTRRVILVAGGAVALSLPVIGLARTPPVLLAGLAGVFLFDVMVDVAMNLQGSWLSARRPVPVMNRLHGLWSLGTLLGGAASSRLASAGVSLQVHLTGAAGVLLLLLAFVGGGLLRIDEHPGTDDRSRPRPGAAPHHDRRVGVTLLLIGLAGLFALALESTSYDWAAFRLTDDLGTTAGFGALGFVAVTLGMTAGRFAGDWMISGLGRRRLALAASALSGVGFATACWSGDRSVSLVGFAVIGVGVATMLPTLYGAAAAAPGRPGAGLGALTAGIRAATLTVPLAVGALAATRLSVGSAMALVALPSIGGFVVVTILLDRGEGSGALGSAAGRSSPLEKDP